MVLKVSLGLKFALLLELRFKAEATVGAGAGCVRTPGWSYATHSWGPRGAEGWRRRCWGGAGAIAPQGPSMGNPPNMHPLQPCLKVGRENGGGWTRMKRRRRNRVKARPEARRREGPCPSSDADAPPSLQASVTETELRLSHGHPGDRRPSQLEALEKGCGVRHVEPGRPRSTRLQRGEALPSSSVTSSFPSLSVAISLEKLSSFPARKETSQSVGDRGLELAQLGSTPAAAVAGVALPPVLRLFQADEASPCPSGWKPRPGLGCYLYTLRSGLLLGATGFCAPQAQHRTAGTAHIASTRVTACRGHVAQAAFLTEPKNPS